MSLSSLRFHQPHVLRTERDRPITVVAATAVADVTTLEHAAESLAERLRQESVEERIDAAVEIGETTRRYLDAHERYRILLKQVHRLKDEDDLDGKPADREDNYNDDDHQRHASVGSRLGGQRPRPSIPWHSAQQLPDHQTV